MSRLVLSDVTDLIAVLGHGQPSFDHGNSDFRSEPRTNTKRPSRAAAQDGDNLQPDTLDIPHWNIDHCGAELTSNTTSSRMNLRSA
jgi:hypothetical protein